MRMYSVDDGHTAYERGRRGRANDGRGRRHGLDQTAQARGPFSPDIPATKAKPIQFWHGVSFHMDGWIGWMGHGPTRQTDIGGRIGLIGLSWAREPFPLAAPAIAPALRPGSPLCPALHCP
ncbi:hypothetical protein C8034_v009130 [Colletotrichum sidae]|uniref:Uncharacterized protein n=2 Tax=Colletotrichum orbiculare species complex TaxID=2707354 RepID=A0A4R8QTM3_9PEZI|nr:hypothetical protein C8035_v001156 [Colletotrichum spinosum]TEA17513.1 hypothetical protein C8034_v009130 [Colletotrichum sidae]